MISTTYGYERMSIPKDAVLDEFGELKYHEWYFRVTRPIVSKRRSL